MPIPMPAGYPTEYAMTAATLDPGSALRVLHATDDRRTTRWTRKPVQVMCGVLAERGRIATGFAPRRWTSHPHVAVCVECARVARRYDGLSATGAESSALDTRSRA